MAQTYTSTANELRQEASMPLSKAKEVLTQRRNWLRARIAAKESVGWDVTWDKQERDALTKALEQLGQP